MTQSIPPGACRPHRRMHALGLALQGALSCLATAPAQAADPSTDDPVLRALLRPQSTVEIGVRAASNNGAKAQDYSGWDDKRPALFGQVDLRGGGTHDGDDLLRWRVSGTRLGSRSAEAQADVSWQGTLRIKLGVDELRHLQSDTYQSPYLGVGTPVLTLPTTWVVPTVPTLNATTPNARGLSSAVTGSSVLVAGVLTTPTAAQAAAASAQQATNLAAFQSIALYTQRSGYNLGWQHELGPGWSWNAGVAHEHTQGLKALPAQSRLVGGDTSSILPAPVDQDDDRAWLGLSYTAEGLQWQAQAEESVYTNHVPSVTWSLWAAPRSTATASVAPSNRFRKFDLTGSLALGPSTTLSARASASRTTQNDPFLSDPTALLVPAASAQAKVAGQDLQVKLLHRATPRLQLSASWQENRQDNQTPVGIYGYYDNNNPAAGTSPFAARYPQLSGLGSNFNLNANTPYSRRVQTVDIDAAYRLGGGRHMRAAWQTQETERHCSGSWISCADAPRSSEHTLRLEGGGPWSEAWSGRMGLTVASRRVQYDENAFLAVVPMAGQTPATATGGLTGTSALSTLLGTGLTGYGPVLGLNPAAAAGSASAFYFPANNVLSNTLYGNQNRISELLGMRRYNQAARERVGLRGSVQWLPDERWSMQAQADVQSDHYAQSAYGLQRSGRWSLHLDAAYQRNERFSAQGFASWEDHRSRSAGNTYTANSAATNVNGATAVVGGCYATLALRNANNKIDPCLDWMAALQDQTATMGGSLAWRQLAGGRLDLSAGAVFSTSRNHSEVAGGSYVNNPLAGVAGSASAAVAATYFAATPLPVATVRSATLHLQGDWRAAERQMLRLGYAWQHLRSDDWRYQGFQDGALTQVLPSHEQAPQADVHILTLSWLVSW